VALSLVRVIESRLTRMTTAATREQGAAASQEQIPPAALANAPRPLAHADPVQSGGQPSFARLFTRRMMLMLSFCRSRRN